MARKNRVMPQVAADQIQTAAPSSFLLYCVTWNLAGKFPSLNELSYLLPPGYDIYVVCTQECGQSISASFVSSIAHRWSELLTLHFTEKCGKNTYTLIENQSLVAMNMQIFVRRDTVSPHLTHIDSQSVPTGIGGLLGNKGGVAISFVFDSQFSFLFVNSHFHAHQDSTMARNEDYLTINRNLSLGQEHTVHVEHKSDDEKVALEAKSDDESKATQRFDVVVWSGDLNYRVNGNRKIMDALCRTKQFDVMLQNDQLNIARDYAQVFEDGFVEEAITFPPTYKYDLHCDEYDTSAKARIPSWTDRILYKQREEGGTLVTNLKYDAIAKLKISDHRPVFATFKISTKPDTPHRTIEMHGKRRQSRYRRMSTSRTLGVRTKEALTSVYRLCCMSLCCLCLHSGCWKRMFRIRSSRVKMADKME